MFWEQVGDGWMDISTHHHIRRFLRGVSIINLPVIYQCPNWDLNLVLNILTGTPFKPLATVPIRELMYKVLFLVAVTTARRVLELGALSTNTNMCVFHKGWFHIQIHLSFQKLTQCYIELRNLFCLPFALSQYTRKKNSGIP